MPKAIGRMRAKSSVAKPTMGTIKKMKQMGKKPYKPMGGTSKPSTPKKWSGGVTKKTGAPKANVVKKFSSGFSRPGVSKRLGGGATNRFRTRRKRDIFGVDM